MRVLKFIMIVCISLLIACKTANVKPANQYTISDHLPNELLASNEVEFEVIKGWVEDKTIVSLGESSHGIGEFYSLKSKIVEYLHDELGFEVLMMEGGLADSHLAWKDIGNLSASDFKEKAVYGNFSCSEVSPLFNFIKEKYTAGDPLYYAGFDTQLSGNLFRSAIDTISRHLRLNIDIKEELGYYSKMYQASFEQDSTHFTNYKSRYLSTVSTIKRAIEEHKNTCQDLMNWSELDYQVMIRTLDMLYQSVDYHYAEKFTSDQLHQGFVLRDKYMAENVQWLMDHIYTGKKVVIWGHNGHIQKGKVNQLQSKAMGQLLKEEFKDKYFSIGIFAYKGQAYQHWTGESIDFENNDSTALELNMNRDDFKYTYQQFTGQDSSRWFNKDGTALEIESAGIVYFVPSERFDAAICIDSVGIPTF